MNIIPRLAIFICTFIGASTIVLAETLLKVIPPYYLLGTRFLIAAIVMAILFPTSVFPLSKASIRAGITAGAGFGIGCLMLYLALPHVRAGKLTFLVALEVLIVPLLCALLFKQKARHAEKIALLPAVAGLWLITGNNSTSITGWEVIALLSAFAYAIYTISLSHNPAEVKLFSRTFISFLLIGFLALAIALSCETISPALLGVWDGASFVYLVLVGSLARFLLQTWAQQHVSPSFAALTFTAEPVFAILLSYIFLGERFSTTQSIGAVLIVTALIISNLQLRTPASLPAVEI